MRKFNTSNSPSLILCLVLGMALIPQLVTAQIKAESIVMSMTDMGELVVNYEIDKANIKAREKFTIEALHILEDGQPKTVISSEALSGTLEISNRDAKGQKQIKYTLPKDSRLKGNQVKLEYKAIDNKQIRGSIKRLQLWNYVIPFIGDSELEKKKIQWHNNQISEKKANSIWGKKEPDLTDSIVLVNEPQPKINYKAEPKAKFSQWLPTLISLLPISYGIGQWIDANNKEEFSQAQRDKFAKNASIAFGIAGTIYAADILHLFVKNRKFVKKQKKKHHYKPIK